MATPTDMFKVILEQMQLQQSQFQQQQLQLQQQIQSQQQQHNDLLKLLVSSNQPVFNPGASASTSVPVAASVADTHANLFDRISNHLTEFTYDPEVDCVFAKWLDRYRSFISVDGAPLPEEMRVRLILNKLSPKNYNQYTESILLKVPSDLNFLESIERLSALFGDTKSIYVRRFETFQMKKSPMQDVLAFYDQVNAAA